MPRSHRITRADFLRLDARRGKRFHGAFFSLLVAPLPGVPRLRFACVVSKKISPKAVVRNRIERRAREAARPALAGRADPLAYVLYPKREAVKASARDLAGDIRALFDRADR